MLINSVLKYGYFAWVENWGGSLIKIYTLITFLACAEILTFRNKTLVENRMLVGNETFLSYLKVNRDAFNIINNLVDVHVFQTMFLALV